MRTSRIVSVWFTVDITEASLRPASSDRAAKADPCPPFGGHRRHLGDCPDRTLPDGRNRPPAAARP
ncbi:hypothetical protein GCM10009642_48960 [Nocardiopsis metallicus]